MAGSGTTSVDFGAFPGKSDTSVAVTGQAGIVSGSLVGAWIRPVATADHTADEHLVETIAITAADIVAGTGFTIYATNTNQLIENPTQGAIPQGGSTGGMGTRLYGLFTVAWAWS
jgi:hypothetical protein